MQVDSFKVEDSSKYHSDWDASRADILTPCRHQEVLPHHACSQLTVQVVREKVYNTHEKQISEVSCVCSHLADQAMQQHAMTSKLACILHAWTHCAAGCKVGMLHVSMAVCTPSADRRQKKQHHAGAARLAMEEKMLLQYA